MTTIINLSHSVNNLPEVITNWNEVTDQAKEFMLSGTDFRIINPQELLVYNGRQIIASCSIVCFNNGRIEMENCYSKEGKLF